MHSDAVMLLNGNYSWRLCSSIIDGTLDNTQKVSLTYLDDDDDDDARNVKRWATFVKPMKDQPLRSSLPVHRPLCTYTHCAPGRYLVTELSLTKLLVLVY